MASLPLAGALILVLAAPSRALPPAPAADETLKREVRGIIDLFYDLRFEAALAAADGLTARFPGHPAGPFYRSIVSYQRFLQQDADAQAAFAEFERESTRALEAARAVAGQRPATAEYYQGAALGFQSRALATRRHYASAIPKARRAVRHLKRALELDPSLEDARLGLGMYDYFMSRLPAAAKPFAYLAMGMLGDRERGLKALRQVADSASPARMEARAVLSAIYSSEREGQWAKAEELLRELASKYPGNPLYRLRLAFVLEHEGRHDEAALLADPDSWTGGLHGDLREKARIAGRLRKAEALLFARKPEEARAELDRLEGAELPPKLEGFRKALRASFPKPPPKPTRITWPLAGLPADRK